MRVVAIALPILAALAAAPATAAPGDLGPLVSNQVVRCWSPPEGVKASVKVRFELAPDGSVVGTPKVLLGFPNTPLAISAVKAIIACAPYRLPADRFGEWQHPVVKLSAGGPP